MCCGWPTTARARRRAPAPPVDRLGRHARTPHGGSGLDTIVRAHGGSVTATPGTGSGATFTVTLPVMACSRGG